MGVAVRLRTVLWLLDSDLGANSLLVEWGTCVTCDRVTRPEVGFARGTVVAVPSCTLFLFIVYFNGKARYKMGVIPCPIVIASVLAHIWLYCHWVNVLVTLLPYCQSVHVWSGGGGLLVLPDFPIRLLLLGWAFPLCIQRCIGSLWVGASSEPVVVLDFQHT